MSMSSTDKGLLTPDNCAVVFIDLQPQMLGGVLSSGSGELLDNAVLLAKAAKAFRVPVILTTVDFPGFGGDLVPELVELFPGQERIARTSMNAWDDPRFVAAVRRCGCRNFVVAGLWSETALVFAVLQMLEEGFGMYVVEDASGGTSRCAHDAAIRRAEQAGAVSLTALQFLLELQRDWSRQAHRAEAMAIVKEHRPALIDHCSKDPGSLS
ncbi:isochorismatase family protein [Azoarcus sp. KH32C]|uniref:isochorismatase family protein n=1 Tax=Azoarcus sp. KH32C TaxID=748247 RepID=UPI00155AEE3B|nr:isochorismatase family protein [Azoarcus sp. KH32C]